MSQVENNDERWGRAVSDRLSKLRSMPVDTGRLENALRAQIPVPARRGRYAWQSMRALRAVAASLLLVGSLTAVLLFTTWSRPALASPAQMAKMHEELVSGRVPSVQVDSIEAANSALSSQHPDCPQAPQVPAGHVMACCMKSVKDKKVACVLLKREGVPVTMVVANSADMRSPKSPEVMRNGVSYRVESVGSLSMVMTERHGRWVCLIGEIPADGLMDLASKLDF